MAAALGARGDDVTPLVRRPPTAGEARWDPEAQSIDAGALEGADARASTWPGPASATARGPAAADAEIVSSRVQATTLLAAGRGRARPAADRARERLRRRLLRRPGRRAIDRGQRTRRGVPGRLCRDWEAATEPAAQAGIRVVRLRSGVVLSPHGGALARQLPLFRFGLGGRLGTGRQWLSWISLDDEVGAILHALAEPTLLGPLNATHRRR